MEQANAISWSIYLYENLINNKVYVGQTADIKKRDRVHSKGYDAIDGVIVDAAIRKYGRENFNLTIIGVVWTQEEADEEERYWIARLRESLGKENVYNVADGGSSGMAGKTRSLETKAKMSVFHSTRKRQPHSEETRAKIGAGNAGKHPMTKERQAQLIAIHRQVSIETEDAIIDAYLHTDATYKEIAAKFGLKSGGGHVSRILARRAIPLNRGSLNPSLGTNSRYQK